MATALVVDVPMAEGAAPFSPVANVPANRTFMLTAYDTTLYAAERRLEVNSPQAYEPNSRKTCKPSRRFSRVSGSDSEAAAVTGKPGAKANGKYMNDAADGVVVAVAGVAARLTDLVQAQWFSAGEEDSPRKEAESVPTKVRFCDKYSL
jgi:hypothetical protein